MNHVIKVILGLILGLNLTGCYDPSAQSDFPEDEMNHRRIAPPPQRNVGGNTTLNEKKGWSSSGNLIAGKADGGIGLQAKFEETPGNYTVQFAVTYPPTDQLGNIIKARAEIVWTVEGNDVRRLVDIANGMSVSGVGQSVKVRMYDATALGGGKQPFPYPVSAQVVRGTRPSVEHPPFLYENSLVVNAGSNAVFAIPQNAGVSSVQVYVKPEPVGVNVPLGQAVLYHVTGANGVINAYDPREVSWVPIAPGSEKIMVQNDSAVSLRFTTVWGIDG